MKGDKLNIELFGCLHSKGLLILISRVSVVILAFEFLVLCGFCMSRFFPASPVSHHWYQVQWRWWKILGVMLSNQQTDVYVSKFIMRHYNLLPGVRI